jgi:hypothetical protein
MSLNNSSYIHILARYFGYFVQISSALFQNELETIDSNKGSYTLILSLNHKIQIVIGRLDLRQFRPGIYGYAGNAYGAVFCKRVCGGILHLVGRRIGISPS